MEGLWPSEEECPGFKTHPLYANAQCMHVHLCVIKQMINVCMHVLADHMDCVKADMSDSALHASRHSMPFLSMPCQCLIHTSTLNASIQHSLHLRLAASNNLALHVQRNHADFHAQGAQSCYGHHELPGYRPWPARRLLPSGATLSCLFFAFFSFFSPPFLLFFSSFLFLTAVVLDCFCITCCPWLLPDAPEQ